jgi:hypothetical protein
MNAYVFICVCCLCVCVCACLCVFCLWCFLYWRSLLTTLFSFVKVLNSDDILRWVSTWVNSYLILLISVIEVSTRKQEHDVLDLHCEHLCTCLVQQRLLFQSPTHSVDAGQVFCLCTCLASDDHETNRSRKFSPWHSLRHQIHLFILLGQRWSFKDAVIMAENCFIGTDFKLRVC